MGNKQASPKERILAFLTVATGVLNAYLWKEALGETGFPSISFYVIPIVVALLFTILFSLAGLFIQEKKILISAAVLSHGIGFIFLPFSATVLAGALLSAAAGWYAAYEIAREREAAASFTMRTFLRSGLPLFFTALSLLLAVAYYVAHPNTTQELIPKSMFETALPFVESPMRNVLPGFRRDATVDELLLAFAERELGQSFDISNISTEQRVELFAQGRAALKAQFGIDVRGNEKASDVLYEVVNAQIENILGQYKEYLPIIAAVGLFFAVKTLTFPVYIVTLLLLMVVIQSLKIVHILKIETETISVERLRL